MRMLLDYEDDSKVVSEKEIVRMTEIISSNELSECEKASELYKIGSLYNINASLRHYREKESRNADFVEIIKRAYIAYDKKGFYDPRINQFKCSLGDAQIKLDQINGVYNAFRDNPSGIQTAINVLAIVPDAETFRKTYNIFAKSDLSEKRFDYARPAFANFNTLYGYFKDIKRNGLDKDVKYYNKYNTYFECLDYARFVANTYIDSEDSFDIQEFFNAMGIERNVFDFCIATLEELDVSLHDKLCSKIATNEAEFIEDAVAKFRKLDYAITNGKFELDDDDLMLSPEEIKEKQRFDVLEFLKMVPFKRDRNIGRIARAFTSKYCPDISKNIMQYIYKNNINKVDYDSNRFSKEVLRTKTTIGDKVLGRRENEMILSFLSLSDIPILPVSYNAARKRFVDGEITNESLSKLREEKADRCGLTINKTLIYVK